MTNSRVDSKEISKEITLKYKERKELQNNEQSSSDLWDSIKLSKIIYFMYKKETKGGDRPEQIFEEICDNFF
jgi:hypothetical protein